MQCTHGVQNRLKEYESKDFKWENIEAEFDIIRLFTALLWVVNNDSKKTTVENTQLSMRQMLNCSQGK